MDYDYTYLHQRGCCRVGAGYFENGNSTAQFATYGIQAAYPENIKNITKCEKYESYSGEPRCDFKPYGRAYVAPPYYHTPVDGPSFIQSFPPSLLVQDQG